MDFIFAALPWLCMGVVLAVFFAQSARRGKDKKKVENCSSEGMAIGMCFGVAISTALNNNPGIGLSFGMLIGLVFGSFIEKKNGDES